MILSLFCCTVAFGQNDSTLINLKRLSAQDIVQVELPPLSRFIDLAGSNSRVLYYNEKVNEQREALKISRRTWMGYLRVNANAQYGYTNDVTVYSDITNSYFGKNQLYYGVGMSLAIPISEIIDRKVKTRFQKSRIKSASYEAELWTEDIKIKIIDAYTMAEQNLNILKSMASALTIANAQYQVTESNFISGRTDAANLSNQKNIQTQAMVDFEKYRSALNNALLKLELITKIKILK